MPDSWDRNEPTRCFPFPPNQPMTPTPLKIITTVLLVSAFMPLHAAELKNPQMTDGSVKPDSWTQEWTGSGKISVARDTATFHSAPASLSVKSVDGAAKAQTAQIIDAKGGDTLKVSGYLRADGGATALLGVMAYDGNWTGLGFTAIGNALTGFDWVRKNGTATLPEGTARAGIVLIIEGEGTVWLDDVSIDGTDAGKDAGPKNAPSSPAPAKPEGPRKATSATDPAEGFWPDYPEAWKKTFQNQLDLAKKQEIPLLFLGDSLTQAWPDRPAWKAFEEKGAVSFGIGGDGTPQVLYRLDNGLLDDIKPATIVLQIGVNNVWPGFDAEDTIKGIQAILDRLKEKAPQAKILLCSNLHFFDKGDGGTRERVNTINAAQARMADGKKIIHVDFSEKFVDANGDLKMELFNDDKLHLNPGAYEIWSEAIVPHL